MTFEGFKDDQFPFWLVLSEKKYLASKHTMSLNDTLYRSQEISTIFEMSQSESLHHFWWEFLPASLQEARPPLELLQVSLNGLPRLIFFKTCLYLIPWNYSTVSIFRWCVCVWECQQKPEMNFYYLLICFAEIVGQMHLVDSKPLPKLHKWIC